MNSLIRRDITENYVTGSKYFNPSTQIRFPDSVTRITKFYHVTKKKVRDFNELICILMYLS